MDTEEEFTKKLLSIASGVSLERLRSSRMTETDHVSFYHTLPKLAQISGKILKALSRPALKELLFDIKLVQLQEISILFIDGIDETDTNNYHSEKLNYAEYEYALKQIRHLARSINIPIVVSMKSKPSKAKRGYSSYDMDLGILPDMCDTLFHLCELDYYGIDPDDKELQYELRCLKNNNGSMSTVQLIQDVNSKGFRTPKMQVSKDPVNEKSLWGDSPEFTEEVPF